jgi:hypothetical protein
MPTGPGTCDDSGLAGFSRSNWFLLNVPLAAA